MAGVVFGLDYLFRRKKWQDNSKGEKISLLVNMFSVGVYLFLSALGMLWGIVPGSPETSFGKVLYDATMAMGEFYFIVALAAIILSFVFRKIRKIKASIWTNIIALSYMVVVLTVNYLAGKIL
jgi:drug/metabolite transporter (DMT)-like permease